MDEHNDMFKKAAENFSLDPPMQIWSNVEKDIRRRERKKRFLLFFFIGIAFLTGVVFLQRQTTTINDQPAVQNNNRQGIVEQQHVQKSSTVLKNNSEINKDTTYLIAETNTQKFVQNKMAKARTQKSLTILRSAGHERFVTDTTIALPASTEVNSLNTEESVDTIHAVVFPLIADSSESTLPLANDTLQLNITSDTLLTALADTAKKDSVLVTDSIRSLTKKTRWHLEAAFAPAINYTQLKEAGDYRFIANYRDSSDKNVLTFNYHLTLHYHLAPAMELFTGIGIINIEQEMLSRQVVYGYDTIITPASGPLGGDTTIVLGKKVFYINNDSTGTVTNRFSYIQFPVGVSYNFLPGRKFNIALRPAIAFNKILSFNSYIYNYKTYAYEKAKASDLKTWIITYGAGISFQYSISKKFCVELNTNYNRYTRSIFTSSYPISQRFDQLEFGLALRYGIK